ncbi:cell envelope integrity EipB family protein [Telmatospirillum sp. J64-1]|uniref:cell envelope integrity EipB family protein n=1 Tax=Telmatospirillum sp. J64-1 TaxID=2502183 RepID=UPI00115C9C8D|nr:cell envelope integrity EipB family protein [Telmatospirillum sp. J64-1]
MTGVILARTGVMGGAVAMALLAGLGAAQAANLTPHRAVYQMSLASTQTSSGISAATGTMSYEFSDSCDGWTVQNRTTLLLAYTEGGQVESTWDFATWEAKDGLNYRFRVRSTRDGVLTEQVSGTARLDGPNQGGEAIFEQPEMRMELPPGTLFPTQHTTGLLKAAAGDGRFLSDVVFDGSSEDNPFFVGTAIAGRQPAEPGGTASASGVLSHPLLAAPSWRMVMAFFPAEDNAEQPDYEVSLRYHENGVAQELVQNFGNFSLRGRLESLEALPRPDC